MAGYTDFNVGISPPVVSIPRQYNAASDFIDRHIGGRHTDKTAVIDDNGSYTYAELSERINRTGNALFSLGIKMEDRVAVALLDCIDFPSVFFGCIKAGIVPIPLNTLLTSNDYEYILNDSRVETLVVSESLLEKFEPILGKLSFLKNVIVSGSGKTNYLSFTQLINEADPDLEPAPTTGDDIAFWLYSSGSTGKPKGVMHCHSHLIQTAVLYGQNILKVTDDDIVFSAAKLFFAYGLGNGISFPFLAGATTVLLSGRPTPEAVLHIIKQHQTTIYYGVPSLYAAILADPSNKPERGSLKLRACVSAGEALPKDIGEQFQEWFGAPILDGIGSTEMLHIFLSNRLDDVVYGTSGKPVPGYELKLVNELDETVGVDEIGELVVKGPSSAMAYWNQREKSQHTFRGVWTYTGDKYTVDKEGYYHYCGRTDDMIKVSGQWVSPFEVESTIMQHDKVLEAAVVAMEDESNLIKPKAYVVLKPDIKQSDDLIVEIQEFVKDRIAKHKYPRWIEFVDELPKTATGKIQRFKLRGS